MDSFQLFRFAVLFCFFVLRSERIPPQTHCLILRAGVKQQSMGDGGIAEFRSVEFYLQISDKDVMQLPKSSRAMIFIKGLIYECTFYIMCSGFSVFLLNI